MALGASEWFQVILGASEWFQVVLFGSECWGRGEAQRYLSNPTLLKHADPNPASQISFLLFSFSSPSDLQHRADLLAGSGVSPQVEEPQCCRCSPQVAPAAPGVPFPCPRHPAARDALSLRTLRIYPPDSQLCFPPCLGHRGALASSPRSLLAPAALSAQPLRAKASIR